MSRRLIVTLLALITVAPLLAGQGLQRPASPAPAPSPDVLYRRSLDAWDAGNYPDALRDLLTVMKGGAAPQYLDRVALLTGELFVTTELTTDGRNPRISTNGQYATYESGPPAKTATRLVRLAGGAPQKVADLSGINASFNAAGTHLVYQRPVQSPEWASATEALDIAATPQDRQTAQALVNSLLGKGELVVRDLASGAERVAPTGALLKSTPLFAADGKNILFIGSDPTDVARSDIYLTSDAGAPVRVTDQPGHKTNVLVDPTGAALVYTVTATAPFRQPGAAGAAAGGGRGGRAGGGGAGAGAGAGGAGAAGAARGAGAAGGGGTPPAPNPCGGGGGGRGAGGGTPSFGVVDLRTKATRVVNGSAVTMSADGRAIAWLVRQTDACALQSAPPAETTAAKTLRTASHLDAPALSPDGKLAAYQYMQYTDWEIYVSDQAGVQRRITRDIQHDILPKFLTNDTLVGMIGEPRHRRSYLYDVATGDRTRLFSNNTVRTISPEYVWLPSGDGRHLIIQAERDGDTISAERGVYVVDLTRKVTVADVIARLTTQMAQETDLRQRMTKAYQPIADQVRRTVNAISTTRVYEYEKTLVDFDTKYIGRPGNQKAIDYLTATYASFGYKPDQQWFMARQGQQGAQAPPADATAPAAGIRTANVIVTLRGTENPDLIYVVGSHFDSVQAGPGADDDTTGTCALLEAARVLHDTPLPATVVFASFTGEEAGDLGSKEFVRLAAAAKWNVVGALNNDMIGWAAESARMDNTIRYSNVGIRDLQHGAAFLFSNLITYDAKYYKSTDAQAFFDGWGDIVGGLGSYPVLGNPNYHQATDTIETVNFRQVAETGKVTAATIMAMASSPSRLKGLAVAPSGTGLKATWTPSPEKGVLTYIVAYGPASDPLKAHITSAGATAALPKLPPGTQISVKAVNTRGLEGWDWATVMVK